MCKRVLLIPELFVYFARLPHMERSSRADTIYAPGPSCPDDANNSMKLYAAYRKAYVGIDLSLIHISEPTRLLSNSDAGVGG